MDISKIRIGEQNYNIKDEWARNMLIDIINVKAYGVKGDGVTDDTQAIQNCIDNFPFNTLYFPKGDYLITETLNIKHNKPISLKLNYKARIFTNTNINSIIDFGIDTSNGMIDKVSQDNYYFIDGGIIDCQNTEIGINYASSAPNLRINNTNFINVNHYGIYGILDEYYNSSDLKLTNLKFFGKYPNVNTTTAIHLNANDNTLYNIVIFNCKIGVICNAGNYLELIHPIAGFSTTTQEFNNTIAFKLNGADNHLISCYADTFGISFDIHNGDRQFIDNCMTFFWRSPNDANCIIVNLNNIFKPNVSITNCNFNGNSNGLTTIIKSLQEYSIVNYNTIYLANNFYNTPNAKEYDLAYNLKLNNKNTLIPFNNIVRFENNKYYMIGYILAETLELLNFDFSTGSPSKNDIVIFYKNTTEWSFKYNLSKFSSNTGTCNLVLADPITIDNKTYVALLLKTTSDELWSQIALSNLSGNLYAKENKNIEAYTPSSIIGSTEITI